MNLIQQNVQYGEIICRPQNLMRLSLYFSFNLRLSLKYRTFIVYDLVPLPLTDMENIQSSSLGTILPVFFESNTSKMFFMMMFASILVQIRILKIVQLLHQ